MKSTPKGVRDLLPDLAKQRTRLVRQIQDTFEAQHFERVVTPTFEYFDSLRPGLGAYLEDECFRFIDHDGQLITLRPDMTAPIARMVAHQLTDQKKALKLYYSGPVFRRKFWQHELYQAGVEVIGSDSIDADVQVLVAIDEALRKTGLTDYRIDIGDVSGLARRSPKQKTALLQRDYVSAKSIPVISATPGADSSAYIKKLYRCLSKKPGFKKRIQFNQGLVKDIAYYSGLVFEVISPRYGYVLAAGGRYDTLLAAYGDDRPAVGGAIHIDHVIAALGIAKRQRSEALTIAVPKGHLLKKTLALFGKAGYQFDLEAISERKLSFTDRGGKLRFIVIRPTDVPVYVEHGAADLGIVGKDILNEVQPQVAELLDLKYGHCRLVVAAPKAKKLSLSKLSHHLRVATKFTHCAEKYFSDRGFKPEIIKLYGSVELGPMLGLSDVIVDLVDTGATLKENGMEIIAEIFPTTARLVANTVSLRARYDTLLPLITQLAELR